MSPPSQKGLKIALVMSDGFSNENDCVSYYVRSSLMTE